MDRSGVVGSRRAHRRPLFATWLFAVLVASLVAPTASGQRPGASPEPRDPTQRVHDFAGVLSPDQESALEALAQGVERETTAQLAIVTITSLEGKSVEAYATELFNRWGIGQRESNNGVLILVDPGERRMRIEVGRGLEPLLTDSLCGDIRDEQMLPRFRLHDVPGGIRAGAERVAGLLRAYPAAARGVPGSAPLWVRTARTDAVQSIWASGLLAVPVFVLGWWAKRKRSYSRTIYFCVWAVTMAVLGAAVYLILRTPRPGELFAWLGASGAVLGGATVFNLLRYRRFRAHDCPHCGSREVLLDESADDEKLSEVQRLEEKLGSVDYDVWYCPACLQSDCLKYLCISEFSACPKCHARTARETKRETQVEATTTSDGLLVITRRCMSCHATSTEKKTIPRIDTRSSSGSGFSGGGGGGSGFGGGSSGGGGASGSW